MTYWTIRLMSFVGLAHSLKLPKRTLAIPNADRGNSTGGTARRAPEQTGRGLPLNW